MIYQFYNVAFVYQGYVLIDYNFKRQKQPNYIND